MKSKYICQTCAHHSINPNDDEYCMVLKDFLYDMEMEIISKIGCASHSDFKNQRKEIFDSICKRLNDYYYSLPKDSPYLDGIDMSSQEIEKLYAEGEV